eukprot:420136-Prymnesium_polylepis.1
MDQRHGHGAPRPTPTPSAPRARPRPRGAAPARSTHQTTPQYSGTRTVYLVTQSIASYIGRCRLRDGVRALGLLGRTTPCACQTSLYAVTQGQEDRVGIPREACSCGT